MDGIGAPLAIAAGALLVVFLLNRQREANTQMLTAQLQKQSQPAPVSDTLTFKQVFQGGAIAVSTYIGGPGAGAATAKAVL